jgi:hypothetical protein
MNLYEGLVNRQCGSIEEEPVARLPFCSDKRLLMLGIEKVEKPDVFPVLRVCFNKHMPKYYGVPGKARPESINLVKILPA